MLGLGMGELLLILAIALLVLLIAPLLLYDRLQRRQLESAS